MKMAANCEFCAEIQGQESTRFHEIYGTVLSDRGAAESWNFIAFPTIGQLFKGSLLIAPKIHEETFAKLSHKLKLEAIEFISKMMNCIACYGSVIVFEHGASSDLGTGCGIYHAHTHLVPLPTVISHDELVEHTGNTASNMFEAWCEVEDLSEYLVLRDGTGSVTWFGGTQPNLTFGSQYLRRRLVEYFKLDNPWDWRKYTKIEPTLLETLSAVRMAQS